MSTLSQNQNSVWHFGTYAGVDFSAGSATSLSGGQTNSYEGVSSACDPNGKLLFYTDGVSAWDKNHNLMPNGSGLAGGISSTQTLIVPFPENCSKYYIFHVQDHGIGSSNRLSYSVVDMCLNNGLGDVIDTQKNIFLLSPCGEKLTAVKHQNNIDIWVITHKLNCADFAAFQITPSNILAPVITAIGGMHASNHMIGPIKANHAGNKICLANTFGNLCELFDFDNATGLLSNYVNLVSTCMLPGGIYGIEFSPNDNLLYLSTTWVVNNLYQIDLSSGFTTTILSNGPPGNYIYGALQSAPDGKIYLAHNGSNTINVINMPDTPGPGANFVAGGLTLSAGAICQIGLPNFTPFTIYGGYNDGFIVDLGNDTVTACTTINLSATSFCNSAFLWSNGSTDSTLSVTSSGLYWVTVSNVCGSGADTIQVCINPSLSVQASGSSVCSGDSITLIAGGGNNYWWLPPVPAAQQNEDTIRFAPDFSTTYYLAASGPCGPDTVSVSITVKPLPAAAFTFSENCSANLFSAVLAAHITWHWDFGDGTTAQGSTLGHIYGDTGTYLVSLFAYQDGCSDSVSQQIQVAFIQDSIAEIPNVFTPNGDQVNERYIVNSRSNCRVLRAAIYDRWGVKLFESDNILKNGWNGKVNDEEVPDGVYYVLVFERDEIVYKGPLYVIR